MLGRDVGDGREGADARIDEQDIEAAMRLPDRVEHVIAALDVTDIRHETERTGDLGDRLVDGLARAPGQEDMRPFLAEIDRGGAADAAVAADDQHHLVLEPHHALP